MTKILFATCITKEARNTAIINCPIRHAESFHIWTTLLKILQLWYNDGHTMQLIKKYRHNVNKSYDITVCNPDQKTLFDQNSVGILFSLFFPEILYINVLKNVID